MQRVIKELKKRIKNNTSYIQYLKEHSKPEEQDYKQLKTQDLKLYTKELREAIKILKEASKDIEIAK